MMPTSTKGILGHFYEPADALAAAAKVRAAGWKHFDFLTPFPIHGMEEAMGRSDRGSRMSPPCSRSAASSSHRASRTT